MSLSWCRLQAEALCPGRIRRFCDLRPCRRSRWCIDLCHAALDKCRKMGVLTGSLVLRGLRCRCHRYSHRTRLRGGRLHSLSIDNHICPHGDLHDISHMIFGVHVTIDRMLLIGPRRLSSQLLSWLGIKCPVCGQFGIVGTKFLCMSRYGLCEFRSLHKSVSATCIVLHHESFCRRCTAWLGIVPPCVL